MIRSRMIQRLFNWGMLLVFMACLPTESTKPLPLPIEVYPNAVDIVTVHSLYDREIRFTTHDTPAQVIAWYEAQIPAQWHRFRMDEYNFMASNLDVRCSDQDFVVMVDNPTNQLVAPRPVRMVVQSSAGQAQWLLSVCSCGG